MKRKVLAAAAGIAMAAAAVGTYRGDIVVRSDPGGNIVQRYHEFYEDWKEGKHVAIDGRCASACTMRLVFPNVCVTPNARLGFHRSYYLSVFGWKIGSAWGDRYMLDRLPPLVRAYVEPRISHDMLWVNAAQARALGVPAC